MAYKQIGKVVEMGIGERTNKAFSFNATLEFRSYEVYFCITVQIWKRNAFIGKYQDVPF